MAKTPGTPRLGAHVSGGVAAALERAQALGCDCLQIFTASPRQWRAPALEPERAAQFRRQRRQYALGPVVVHANYLINLAGANPEFHARSVTALRGEIERAAAIGADYLVLHPGSGEVERCVRSIIATAAGLDWGGLTLLIENTAGGGSHLGGSFRELAHMIDRVGEAGVPVGACIDSCHAWVAGYDLASEAGYAQALDELEATVGLARVPVIHANDAKAKRGSHHDRHQHIGEGELGTQTFRRLLNDRRLRGKAFVLETPVDEPGDQERDLAALRALARAIPE